MAEQFGGKQALETLLEQVATDALAEPALQRLLPWYQPPEPKPVKTKPKPKGRPMTREQAEAVASNLEGYDGRVKAGRLTGG